jgi:GLPGLI family protein
MNKSNRVLLLLLVVLVNTATGFCQEKFAEQATYKVLYRFSFVFDTTDISKHYTEEMSLYIGPKYSVFRNAQYEVYEAQMEKLKSQIMENLVSGKSAGNIKGVSNKIPPTEMFRNIATNTIYKKEVLVGRDYLIQDNLTPIKWNIDPETSTLNGIQCQKATGSFRGRDYIVWFAPSIPVRAGPWKLAGLPGLILQAADQTQEVVFTFVSVQRLDKPPHTIISLPQQYVKTSEQDFQKLRNAYLDDPAAFTAARNAASGVTVSVSGLDSRPVNEKKKPVKSPINNALELAKK